MTTAISSPTDDTRYKDMRSRSPVTQSSRQLSGPAFDAKSANRYLQPTVLSPPTTAYPPPIACALQPKSHLQSRWLESSVASCPERSPSRETRRRQGGRTALLPPR